MTPRSATSGRSSTNGALGAGEHDSSVTFGHPRDSSVTFGERRHVNRRPVPEAPGPGQESVWDYPRPPRLEEFRGSLTVALGGRAIGSTERGWRVLETSHPPTYYLPESAFEPGVLRAADGSSWCEWKGMASYYDLVTEARVAPRAAWTYPHPTSGF